MNRRPALQLILVITVALLAGISCADNSPVPTAAAEENRAPPSRADGATPLTVSASGSLQNPAWSPDSGALLLTRFVNGYNVEPADLLILDLTTGRTRTLVSDGSGNVNLPGSAWNRATGHIVFSSSRDPHDEIYTIYAAGPANDEWQITGRNDRVTYEPASSPDGEWIVFESHPLDVEDNGVITTYKIDGSQPYRALTPASDDCRQPNWSPAGDLILYQKFANGRWDLWTVPPDGSTHRQITTGSGDKTDASFSPDGQWIVYSSDEGGLDYANLFIIPATGGGPTRLTVFNGYDGAPSWSPDGRWIAFESAPGDPDAVGATTLWRIPVPQRFAPRLLFDGGFETGNTTQWAGVNWNQHRPLGEQLQIVTGTVRQGKYAAQTTVHDGDEFLDTGGERIDLESPGPREHEGDDYWYAWSTRFSTGWQPPNDWLLIVDWHSTYPDVCQPLQLELDSANALSVQILTGDVTGYDCFDGPGTALNKSQVIIPRITPGAWNDFVVHVKWTTSNNGLIEIWHKLASAPQFTKVLDWRGIPTLQYQGDPAQPDTPYLILAHYRDAGNTHTSILYHDGFRMALHAAALVEGDLYNLSTGGLSKPIYLPLALFLNNAPLKMVNSCSRDFQIAL